MVSTTDYTGTPGFFNGKQSKCTGFSKEARVSRDTEFKATNGLSTYGSFVYNPLISMELVGPGGIEPPTNGL